MGALKAIGIAGSPRAKGNSTTLMQAALDGAAEAGASIESVHVDGLSFRGCQGCEPCTTDDSCILTDDLTPVMAKMRASDIWVLAAPIYYDGVSGQLKLFFDRLRHVTHSGFPLQPMLEGPRAAAIIVTYADGPRDDYRDVADRLAAYLPWMGEFVAVEVMSVAHLGPPGDAAGKPELLAQAGAIGKRLHDALTGVSK